ncbi:MAG: LacI family DNA-binding transcriptional regulator [Burkholderiales bacterium]|nr:LacI family DNA-binding transcriptional regulator [Burkholderiales bacterium]
MPRKPTMVDVAERARVSLGTVSNVINGRAHVGDTRRARVEAAMVALGYVPNAAAQTLRRSESRVIGLCAPLTSSAYFAALLEVFEQLAAADGYEIMQVLSRGDPALELRRVQALVGRNVDALILIPTYDARATLDLVAERATPTVIVDRIGVDRRFDYVAIDDRRAMRKATREVLTLGHRRLLFIVNDPRLPTTHQRIEGFEEAVRNVRAARAAVLQRKPADDAFAQQLRQVFRETRPTAIIASNSAIALTLVHNLMAMGKRWPADVSLLAFDEPVWAPILSPPLAVVRHPTQRIARETWQRILLRIREPATRPRRVMLEAEYVAAASLAPPPSGQRGGLR